jgi:ankyrin repeat protein
MNIPATNKLSISLLVFLIFSTTNFLKGMEIDKYRMELRKKELYKAKGKEDLNEALVEAIFDFDDDVIELVKYLLNQGADPNYKGRRATPMFAAICKRRNPQIIKLLLEHSAHPVLSCEAGTPLQCAVTYGNIEAIKALLSGENKADINTKDSNGKTALHYAIEFHEENIAELLIECGADTTIEGEWAPNPRKAAEEHGLKKVVNAIDRQQQKIRAQNSWFSSITSWTSFFGGGSSTKS